MRFGLMFFAASEEASASPVADAAAPESRYRLVLEAARFADRRGFESVWVPERHFTQFGGLYPNPAVLQAALARETQRVSLRAGSVVLPLHDPIRVVEEWSMVDNLSGGRVGVSFASGWNPADFAFFPERYDRRRQDLAAGIETVRRLWRGEAHPIVRGDGVASTVNVLPTPVQPELPIWVTAAGNPETYVLAGQMGAHLLTHLLDQGVDELAAKIARYRQAREQAGHAPETGTVSLMLHTFLGEDVEAVRAEVREPYCRYLESNLGLLQGLARSRGTAVDVQALSAQDRRAFVGLLYDRFASARGLIGTPDSCQPLVADLARAGVDEIACLLDFGPPADAVLARLPVLERLARQCRDLAPARPSAGPARSTSMAPRIEAQPVDARSSDRPDEDRLSAVEVIQQRCPGRMRPTALYDQLARHGIEMTGPFRRIEAIWRRDGEALARLATVASAPDAIPAAALDTVLLDASLQAMIAALPTPETGSIYLPSGARQIEVVDERAWSTMRWSHAVVSSPSDVGNRGATGSPAARAGGDGTVCGDIVVRDEHGALVARVLGLRLSPFAADARHDSSPSTRSLASRALVGMRWQALPSLEPVPAGTETDSAMVVDASTAHPIAHPLAGDWLLVADCRGVAAALAAEIRAAGGRVETLRVAVASPRKLDASVRPDDRASVVDPRDADAISVALRAWRDRAAVPRGVVHLASLDAIPPQDGPFGKDTATASDPDTEVLRAGLAVSLATGLHLIQSWAHGLDPSSDEHASRGGRSGMARSSLWCVTQGAQAVPVEKDGDDGPAGARIAAHALAQAPLWGLARVATLEHPHLAARLVDLDPEARPAQVAADLARELAAADMASREASVGAAASGRASDAAENLVAYRAGRRFGARLEMLDAVGQTHSPVDRPAARGQVLITGGRGGLGLQLAAWLIARGYRHLVLIGRQAPDQAVAARLDALRTDGVIIESREVDVAHYDDLAALLAGYDELSAVFHLAGVPDARLLQTLSWEQLGAVRAAKVEGAWNLHRLTEGRALDHFVLFSSAAAMLPLSHQGAYAAASTFLDSLAHHRHGRGLPALSINWGPWSGEGHASWETLEAAYRRFAALGVGSLAPAEAFAILGDFLNGRLPDGVRAVTSARGLGRPQVGVIPVDWPRLLEQEPQLASMPLLASMIQHVATRAGTGGATRDGVSGEASESASWGQPAPWVNAIREAAAEDRAELLRDHLRTEVASILRLPSADAVDPQRGFFDAGMDSLMAIELRAHLQRAMGCALPATLAFEHPTIDALADHLARMYLSAGVESDAATAQGPAADETISSVARHPELDEATAEAHDDAVSAVRGMDEAALLAMIDGELETIAE